MYPSGHEYPPVVFATIHGWCPTIEITVSFIKPGCTVNTSCREVTTISLALAIAEFARLEGVRFPEQERYLELRISRLHIKGSFYEGFKKDLARHEAKHNPGVLCDWDGCDRVFSRVDNMRDHVKRIHLKASRNGTGPKSMAT
ncbi:hypothetical protein N0V90_010192 [Kalmusia sp. IMI 367209]|nr:hypothetical protein N0V90_010192 [Kalmusia sp. IMI 367209]